MEQMDIVAAVKKHAQANYEKDGWDIIVECWGTEEIVEVLNGDNLSGKPCQSVEAAIAEVREIAKLHDDRRKDIQATAW